jgi:thiosulfate dehydrogenase [quinone] large subunit
MVFLIAACSKLTSYSGWLHGPVFTQFDKLLPHWALVPYIALLPFVELTVGVCLLLGLFTRPALFLTGLLLLSLNFGLLLTNQHSTAANNFIYLLAVAGLLAFADYNRLAIDTLREKGSADQ